jgi:hypothetical protein
LSLSLRLLAFGIGWGWGLGCIRGFAGEDVLIIGCNTIGRLAAG